MKNSELLRQGDEISQEARGREGVFGVNLMRPGRHLAVAVRSSTQAGAIDKRLLLQWEREMQFGLTKKSDTLRSGVVLQFEFKRNVSQATFVKSLGPCAVEIILNALFSWKSASPQALKTTTYKKAIHHILIFLYFKQSSHVTPKP